MKPSTLLTLSFGCTLALVVGVRLTLLGLLVTGLLLWAGMLLGPLVALRWLARQPGGAVPEVRIEREPPAPLASHSRPARALSVHPRQARRGGWPHLEKMWGGDDVWHFERNV